eukprot:CAMPEP_0113665170 /NCGR_PEP_ID=MMETSP0038_2-20120614/2152_1 /TAXON_ID=2898 /ORGANISM="Cryptomonas paramecium" /LENGTH=167 /DNA_ID=CAMNT_0000580485 /DNA_START=91 /DNA_END=591 /DNA_ORIENTATION=+ /assembly_acc=CAM_ASM_000170
MNTFEDVLKDVEVDEPDENGDTALHICVRNGNFRACEILCQYGANVEIRNKQYLSPISIARAYNFTDIRELLCQYRTSTCNDHLSENLGAIGTSTTSNSVVREIACTPLRHSHWPSTSHGRPGAHPHPPAAPAHSKHEASRSPSPPVSAPPSSRPAAVPRLRLDLVL